MPRDLRLYAAAIGTLQTALHEKKEAKESFEKALLLADTQMSHHLGRVALADSGADYFNSVDDVERVEGHSLSRCRRNGAYHHELV